MSGMRIWDRIPPMAAAASASGTATRTISQPAASRAQIWSTVAWTFARVRLGHRLDGNGRAAADRHLSHADRPRRPPVVRAGRRDAERGDLGERAEVHRLLSVRAIPHGLAHGAQPAEDVVVEREDHEPHQENHPDLLRDLPLAQTDRLPAQPLDQGKEQVPAVQDRDRQEVEDGQIDGQERREREQIDEAALAPPRRPSGRSGSGRRWSWARSSPGAASRTPSPPGPTGPRSS